MKTPLTIDLRLSVEREVIGILRHEHVRDRGLGGQSALNQARRGRRLHHHVLTPAAGVFGATRHQHPELRRHDIEPLGDILADPVQRSGTAGAGRIVDLYKALDPRQVGRQGTSIPTPMGGPGCSPVRLLSLVLSMAGGLGLLDLFEREQQLIFRQGLGAATEAVTLQFLDDLAQPLALGALGQEHCLEQIAIVGQSGGCGGHEAE